MIIDYFLLHFGQNVIGGFAHEGPSLRLHSAQAELLIVLVESLLNSIEAGIDSLLQCYQLSIDRVPLKQVLLEDAISPLAEACADLALDTVAHGDNGST